MKYTTLLPCCFLGLVWILVDSKTTTAQHCSSEDDIEAERTIYHNQHARIEYIMPLKKGVLRTNEDLKLRYLGEIEVVEVEGVPQYFTDLRDRDVEQEVKYRVEHNRWSDRVILEKLYFGLLFGKSGFPDHYYINGERKDGGGVDDDNTDRDNDEEESSKLEKAFGWDIFLRDENYCEWTGISCHDNKVTEIRLSDFGLNGTLTEDIQYLSDLEYLDLQENSIGGTIPTTLSNLKKLTFLNLAINNFHGTLPRKGLRFNKLEKLFLATNALTGSLPKALLLKLPELTMLDLSKNRLTGTIPLNYATESRKLVYMYLESNQLTGKLPERTSGLQFLQVLDVADNRLSGTIPTAWMSLTKLESISLGNNRLTGTIPTELLYLSHLSVLVLSQNILTGKIPEGTDGNKDVISQHGDGEDVPKGRWSNLSKLHVVLLNDNLLSGTLPSALIEASAEFLMNLDLANNTFTGTFPSSIGKLKNLKRFHAQLNRFNGTLPASISRLSPILDLNLTGNLLVGSVPRTFCGSGARSKSTLFRQFGCDAILCPPGTFHPSGAATMESACRTCPSSDEDEDHDPPLNRILGRLDCPGTEFVHGDLDGDGDLSQIEILRLLWTYTVGRNWGAQFQTWADPYSNVCDLNGITCVNGNIAKIDLTDASMCTDSSRKLLSECHGLPAELSLLTDLEILTMNHRQFLHSTIPSEFGRLTKLKYLDIGASPNMGGTLPTELGRMTSMKILNFAGCRFTGTIPDEFYQMTKLEKLHLSMNAFTGTLSPKIGKLTNLKELMWSRSQLSGPIPNEIGHATSLENWELYGNQLTGTIPSSLGNCSYLKRIDLFNNKFEGSLPESLTKLSSLQILHIKLNHLTGTIPAGFGDLPFLTWFDVSSNRLHGTIPANFGYSRSIKDFRLAGNMIYEPIPRSLCTNTNINGGLTRTYGCDGVICPLGTYSASGHATHSEGCQPCPEGATTIYLGSVKCEFLNEVDILAIYFNVMGGSARNAVQKSHWGDPEGNDPCSWNGIKCDAKGDISSIRFPLMGLEEPDYKY